MYAREPIGTSKDELYEEMHEGPPGEEDDSQDEPSVQALPQEIMEAMEQENYSNMEIPTQENLYEQED